MNKHQNLTAKQGLPVKKLQAVTLLKSNHAQLGVTLIELMVALVIGLVVSLAVYSVLNASEGRKRTTTSVNDIDQAGSYAAYQLDKALRSSGSGFTGGLNPNAATTTNAAAYSFACKLNVSKAGSKLLGATTAYPAPFASIQNNLTLAPIVIVDGAATRGDILISMGGSGGLSESITNLTSTPSATALKVNTTASISADDRLLLISAKSDSSPNPGQACVMEQVKTGYSQGTGAKYDVDLAGSYFDGGGTLSSYNATSIALNLGKKPNFNMVGVGANNTLFKYDLLEPAVANSAAATAPNPSEFVDGVFEMHAIYGVTNLAGATGNFAWQPPTGTYASSALLAGTSAANALLQTITLVRVALVMRTSLIEKTNVSANTLKLFESTGAATTLTISGLDQRYRYRVIEATIPIRNALAAAAK